MSTLHTRKRCLELASEAERSSVAMAGISGLSLSLPPGRLNDISSPPEKHFCFHVSPGSHKTCVTKTNSNSVRLECPRFANKLLQHMNSLRIENRYCDLILVAATESDGFSDNGMNTDVSCVEFPVHKIVMVSSSDYFEAMMRSNMVESQQKRIELKGITSIGLRRLIELIYSGVLEISLDTVQDILGAASFLQISEAIDLCSHFLESSITLDTVVAVLSLAEFYDIDRLIEKAHGYCLEHFDELAETDDFLRLTFSQMNFLLRENRLRVRDEFRLFQCLCRWLEHDITSRQHNIHQLVANIRLPLLTGEQLVEDVSVVPFMRTNTACRELLNDAKDYHIIVSKQPLLQTERTQVRCDQFSVVMCHAENLEAYNIRQKKHCFLKDCPISMYNPQVAVVNNFLYVCGGRYDCNEQSEIASARCFRYDPRFDVWHELTPMNEARKDFVLLAVNDELFAIGGQDENMVMCTVEKFSIRRNEWEYCSSLRNSVYGHAGTTIFDNAGNLVLYISGGTRHDGFADSLKYFDTVPNQWQDCASMHFRRANHIMEGLKGHIFVLGGNVEDNFSFPVPVESIESYDIATNQWTVMKTKINIREAGSCVANKKESGEIFIAGGLDGEHYYSHTIQMFEPEKDCVTLLQRFPTRIYGKACAILVLPQTFSI